jgi:hypothetical protein
MALKFLSLMVQRLRSKAFSPVCLSRFLESLPLIPITTQSLEGEERVRGFKFRILDFKSLYATLDS